MSPRWKLRFIWLLGFLIVANLFLVPGLDRSPRATDIMGLVLGVGVIVHFARRGFPTGSLAVLGIANVLPAIWCVLGILEGEIATVVQSGRWLVAIPWSLALLVLLREESHRRVFAWGLACGCLVNVGVILAQAAGYESLMRAVGLSSDASYFGHYVYKVVRIPGLHGHPNVSSAVTSLIVPAVFYLYFRRHAGAWLPLVGLGAFMMATHLTSTRSPLAVSAVTVLLALVAARSVGRAIIVGTFGLAVMIPVLIVVGPPGGRTRWADVLALQANTSERITSTLSSLGLALEHPIGLGVNGGQAALYDRTFLTATHNAVLQSAVYFGILLAILLVAAFVFQLSRLAIGTRSPHFLCALLAAHTLGLFFFEEHLNNPTFVILATWYLAMLGAGREGAGLPVSDDAPAPATATAAESPPGHIPPLPREPA